LSKIELIQGDCLEKMKDIPDNSIDAVISDPPYELGFMGKKWDNTGIAYNVDLWKEAVRVLKPGGHLIAFGGTRTYHRMACAIEDAGFEVRDMIEWIYASGFPKSLNVGKAVDKLRKGSDKLDEFSLFIKNRREELGILKSEADKFVCGGTTMYSFFEGRKDKPLYFPNNEHYKKIKELLKLDNTWDDFVLETNEQIVGYENGDFGFQKDGQRWNGDKKILELTERAKQWEGFGTALKPAHEPIILARRPLECKTIVENVLKHGTGALDIDGCRIPTSDTYSYKNGAGGNGFHGGVGREPDGSRIDTPEMNPQGRFPANIICTDDALNDGVMTKSSNGDANTEESHTNTYGWAKGGIYKSGIHHGDSGSKSRYFDIDVWAEKHGLLQFPKASKRERNEGCEGLEAKFTKTMNDGIGMREHNESEPTAYNKNHHPTVKPVHLMSWLVRLVSKEGDTVLDPFMGSGTTGVACKKLNRNFIGIELNPEYFKIAEKRINEPVESNGI